MSHILIYYYLACKWLDVIVEYPFDSTTSGGGREQRVAVELKSEFRLELNCS